MMLKHELEDSLLEMNRIVCVMLWIFQIDVEMRCNCLFYLCILQF